MEILLHYMLGGLAIVEEDDRARSYPGGNILNDILSGSGIIVARIDIPHNQLVECLSCGLDRVVVEVPVGRAKIDRSMTDDMRKYLVRPLDLTHLQSLGLEEEGSVGKSVVSDGMAFFGDAPYNLSVEGGIAAYQEKCGSDLPLRQDVQNLRCRTRMGPVVECHVDGTVVRAPKN